MVQGAKQKTYSADDRHKRGEENKTLASGWPQIIGPPSKGLRRITVNQETGDQPRGENDPGSWLRELPTPNEQRNDCGKCERFDKRDIRSPILHLGQFFIYAGFVAASSSASSIFISRNAFWNKFSISCSVTSLGASRSSISKSGNPRLVMRPGSSNSICFASTAPRAFTSSKITRCSGS